MKNPTSRVDNPVELARDQAPAISHWECPHTCKARMVYPMGLLCASTPTTIFKGYTIIEMGFNRRGMLFTCLLLYFYNASLSTRIL